MTGTGGNLEVSVRLLGGVGLIVAGEELALRGDRQRALLARLALDCGSTVPRDVLIEDVWNGSPGRSAAGALRVQVKRLRDSLAPHGLERIVETTPEGYRLVDDVGTDVHELEDALRMATSESSDEAAGRDRLVDVARLLAAPPLFGLEDLRFAVTASQRIRRLQTRALTVWARACLAEGRLDEAEPVIASVSEQNPLDEGVAAVWMEALTRMGRNRDALAVAHRLRAALGEAGLEPGQDIRRREQAILNPSTTSTSAPGGRSDRSERFRGRDAGCAQSPPPPPPPRPSNVIGRDDAFVGRLDELHRLAEIVQPGRTVTVMGPGGIGKTRLAEEFLRQVNPSFRDGTWLVELGPISGRQLNGAVIDALSIGHVGITDLDGLAEFLADRELLLALDNCEHVLEQVRSFVAALRSVAPRLAILSTSRIALHLDGEQVYTLDPLPVPDVRTDPRDSLEFDAMRLFEMRAARHHTGFRITTVNAAAVQAIVHRLDGLPLAIEMAAALVGLRTPQQIAESLDTRFELIHPRATDPRHETLRSLLDWSYELLTPEQQLLLGRLSTFAGGFDAISAAAVCAGDEIDPHHVGDLLEALRMRSLVNTVSTDPVRYGMFDTMRAYGRDLVVHLGQTRELRDRHLAFVRGLVSDLAPRVFGPDQASVFGRLRRERMEIQHALEWAESIGDDDAIVEIAAQLLPWWRIELVPEEGVHWALLACERTHHPETLGRLCAGVALLGHANEPVRSRELIDRAVEAVQSRRHSRERAFVLATAGDACTVLGETERAERLLSEAQRWYREVGDDWGLGYTGLRLFRVLATRAPDLSVAEAAADEFVAALDRSGDTHLLAYAHLARTSMYRLHGRSRQALSAARSARTLSAPLELVYLDAELLTIEAQLSLAFGELASAEQAIAGLRRLGDRRAWTDLQSTAAVLVAELDLARGDYPRAHRILVELASNHDGSDRGDDVDLASIAALAAALTGADFEATTPNSEVLSRLWPWERIEVLYRLAAACVHAGRDPVAHLRAALELLQDVDAPVWRIAAAELAAHLAHPIATRRSEALATTAANCAQALGAKPRAWERAWRSVVPTSIDGGEADIGADARMCADALALVELVEEQLLAGRADRG